MSTLMLFALVIFHNFLDFDSVYTMAMALKDMLLCAMLQRMNKEKRKWWNVQLCFGGSDSGGGSSV